MDFKQAVIRCLRDKYVAFDGRASRSEFWWFALFTFAVGVVFSLIGLDIVGLLFNLAVLLPSLSVGSRRLHDMGKSGWLQLLWFIPVLGWIAMIYFLVQPSEGPNSYGEGPALPGGEVTPAA